MIRVNNFTLNEADIMKNKVIKNKYIDLLLTFLNNTEDDFSEFDLQLINRTLFIKCDKYINYSNNIIFKNNDDKQALFNLMYNNTIHNIVKLLDLNNNYFIDKLNFMRKHEKNTINYEICDAIMGTKFDELVKYKEYYNKLIYIFLHYTGMQRRLIEFLQNKNNITTFKEFNELKLGMISDMFIRYNVHYMYHAINMDRFVNYQRYKDNFKNVYKNRMNYHCTEEPIFLTNENKITTNKAEKSNKNYTTFDFKIFLNIPEDFIADSLFKNNKNDYINNKSIYMYGQFILDDNKEIHVIPHNNQERLYGLGNIALNLKDMLFMFDLMAYCLFLLDNPKEFDKILKNMQFVEKQIITICLFYYLYILQMPYKEGNAFCAEVSFHSLLKKYINPNLVISINHNVILDIEALLLPFVTFYNNCFQSDGTKYTPYFVLNKVDNKVDNTSDNKIDNKVNNKPVDNTRVQSIIEIPKKIFTTWHTKNLPPKMQENVDKLRNSHPDFECTVYDDDDCYNFIKEHFSNTIANTYNKIIPCAYKADLWRYCVLYINGGIYFDIKFGCVDNFNFSMLLDKEYFVRDIYLDNVKKQYVYNGLIVCKPRNQKLLKCINQIVKNVKNNYYGDNALCPTGPGLLNDCFTEIEKQELFLMIKYTDNPLISHPNTNIMYNDKIVISSYGEYRLEQMANMTKPHYGPAWFNKNIYDNNPVFYKTIEPLSEMKIKKKLLIRGWRDINHSYSLINQFQLLEFVKNNSLTIFHEDLPYFVNFWSSNINSSGLNDVDKKTISNIPKYNNEMVDTTLNISTTYRISNGTSKNINFVVLEYILDKTLLRDIKPSDLTKDNNYIVTPSNWSRNKLIANNIDSNKIFVVPHGIDSNLFKPLNNKTELRNKFNLMKDDYIFLNIGGPFHNKGLDILLNAFAKVLLISKNCKLVLKYNEDLYKISLNNYINSVVKDEMIRNNLMENIIIINKTLSLDELNSLYNAVDCYVSSYRAEGFNIPVLEATAAGLNIIVTDGGSTDDFVLMEQTTKIKATRKLLDNNDETSYYMEPDMDDLIFKMLYSKTNNKPINYDNLMVHINKYSWANIVEQLTAVL